MTPARNNVRATRHFGIPARKSSPSNSPILAKPRKNSPGTPLQPFPREKVRPATAQSWPNREKTRPARPKTPKSSHFSQAGRTFSRFPNQFTPQGELFRVSNAAPPSRENFLPQLHHSIPITGTPPPNHHPNRYKTLPTTPTSKPNRYKTLPTTPATRRNRYKTLPARPQSTKTGHFSRAGRIFSRSQRDATEQGEFSPATTPLNTHHRDTTTQHHPNR